MVLIFLILFLQIEHSQYQHKEKYICTCQYCIKITEDISIANALIGLLEEKDQFLYDTLFIGTYEHYSITTF